MRNTLFVLMLVLLTSCSSLKKLTDKLLMDDERASGERSSLLAKHKNTVVDNHSCEITIPLRKLSILKRKKIAPYQTAGYYVNKPLLDLNFKNLMILSPDGDLKIYDAESLELKSKIPFDKKNANTITVGSVLRSDDNVLYVTNGSNVLRAFNAENMQLLWSVNLGGNVESAPVISDGKLFVQTVENRVYSIKSSNGIVLWEQVCSKPSIVTFFAPAPYLYKDTVIIQIDNSEVIFLNQKNGMQVNSINLNSMYRYRGYDYSKVNHVVIAGDELYTISQEGFLISFDLHNKAFKWKKDIGEALDLIVDQNVIYVINTEKSITALDKINGNIKWRTSLPKCIAGNTSTLTADPQIFSSVAIDHGVLFVFDNIGHMMELDVASGKLLAITESVDLKMITGAPALSQDAVYVFSNNGNLYKIQR